MTLDRRAMLTLTGAAAAVAATGAVRARIARAAAPFELPPLPYAEDALAPTISARTVGLHYGRHHKGYYDKLNELVPGTPYADMTLDEVVLQSKRNGDQAIFNNAAQAWNHNLYWAQFEGGPAAPEAPFSEVVERDFGGLDALKQEIVDQSEDVFGTGWVWLMLDGGKLATVGMEDANNPLEDGRPVLLGIDVWEHAYYIDYENRRAEHVAAVLDNLVNWNFVGRRMVP